MKDYFYEVEIKGGDFLLFSYLFDAIPIGYEIRKESIILREEEVEEINDLIEKFKEVLEEKLARKIKVKIKIEKKRNRDWIEAYKKSVKAVEVASFFIHPEWIKPKKDKINILINPALAFGSGEHETTKMCLIAIDKYLKKGMKFLDVGCGSAILSIAAKKKGAEVFACDIDKSAVDIAIKNSKKNGVEINFWVGSVDGKEKFDFVVANILADVILAIKDNLKNSLKKGAFLVLSGIIEKKEDLIKKAFSNLDLIEENKMNEWYSFVFRLSS